MAYVGSNNWGPSLHRGPYGGDNARGCWEWTGCKVGPYGYGKVTHNSRCLRVHRAVFEAIYGREPNLVLHRCDNPLCFRPDHLSDGDAAANAADAKAKDRHTRGERHGLAVLDRHTVLRLRFFASRGWPITVLAQRHGLNPSTVQSVTSGRAWRHVQRTTPEPLEGLRWPGPKRRRSS